jgi:curved DNA-binding protein CbpA
MSVCACGRITNSGQPACDRCVALAFLGLTRAATQTEIKDAYRTLAKVWHPDRFPGDEDLRVKAEEKLKEINSAYQLLTTTEAGHAYGEPSRPATRAEGSHQATAAAPGRATYQRPKTAQYDKSFATKRHPNQKRLAAIAVAILIAFGTWIYLRYGRIASPVDDAPRQAIAKSAVPAGGISQTGQEKKQSPAQATSDSARPAEKTGAQTRANAMASLVVYPDEDPQVPYFTVGSTKNDVVRVQGAPSSLTGNVFRYGLSEVYFKNGRVESWHIDPSSPLKARMPQE